MICLRSPRSVHIGEKLTRLPADAATALSPCLIDFPCDSWSTLYLKIAGLAAGSPKFSPFLYDCTDWSTCRIPVLCVANYGVILAVKLSG